MSNWAARRRNILRSVVVSQLANIQPATVLNPIDIYRYTGMSVVFVTNIICALHAKLVNSDIIFCA